VSEYSISYIFFRVGFIDIIEHNKKIVGKKAENGKKGTN
jgi:hypothetical protein